MKIHIPDIGDTITLAQPWTFELHHEYRNSSFWKSMDPSYIHSYRNGLLSSKPITLPAGTILKVDRVYIRKGAKEFSSVTFNVKQGKKSSRFWAKLKDVNTIEASVSLDTTTAVSIKFPWFRSNSKHQGYGYGDNDRPTNDFPKEIPENKIFTENITVNGKVEYKVEEKLVKRVFARSWEFKPFGMFTKSSWRANYDEVWELTLRAKDGHAITTCKTSQTIKKKVKELVEKTHGKDIEMEQSKVDAK